MRHFRSSRSRAELRGRLGFAALLLLGGLLGGAGVARGAEIIPSMGLTKAVDGNADAKAYGGLALRGDLLPLLQDEIAVSYRSEERYDGLLRTRMWPVTASLWVKPVPLLYAGGGVGWYNVTYDYDQSKLGPLVKDETRQQFGVHLGGGVRVPFTPAAALDLNGRYVMMRDQQSHLVPDQFNPDYWTASLGLALHF